MCTLAILRNVFLGRPIVVAANRDERFDRAAAPPSLTGDEVRVLAPKDLVAGGTWIGVNDRGILAAITDRASVPTVRGLRSRGELVRDALSAPTIDHALAAVMNRDPGEYNGFHLAIVGRDAAYVVTGNGIGGTDVDGHDIEPAFRLGPLPNGINILTDTGCGPGGSRANAILGTIRKYRLDRTPPRPSSIGALLELHDREMPPEGYYGRRQTGTCLHPTNASPDYGTVSSAIIRLNAYPGHEDSWEYWHRDRPKERVDRCAGAWTPPIELRLRAE